MKTPNQAARDYWATQVGWTDAKVLALSLAFVDHDKEHEAEKAALRARLGDAERLLRSARLGLVDDGQVAGAIDEFIWPTESAPATSEPKPNPLDEVTKCTCGSGAHPRRCETHPWAYEAHCLNLSHDSMGDDIAEVTKRLDALESVVKRIDGEHADMCPQHLGLYRGARAPNPRRHSGSGREAVTSYQRILAAVTRVAEAWHELINGERNHAGPARGEADHQAQCRWCSGAGAGKCRATAANT